MWDGSAVFCRSTLSVYLCIWSTLSGSAVLYSILYSGTKLRWKCKPTRTEPYRTVPCSGKAPETALGTRTVSARLDAQTKKKCGWLDRVFQSACFKVLDRVFQSAAGLTCFSKCGWLDRVFQSACFKVLDRVFQSAAGLTVFFKVRLA